MLLGGQKDGNRGLVTPSGQKLLLDVEEILQEKERVSCAIRKGQRGRSGYYQRDPYFSLPWKKQRMVSGWKAAQAWAESRSPDWISRWGGRHQHGAAADDNPGGGGYLRAVRLYRRHPCPDFHA